MVCNLLLVDDHPVFRESLKMLLRPHADLRVVGEASDAAEACELAASTGADVVLLDVKLRESDGREVLREMRRRDSRSRVLMVTMVDDAARAAEAFQAGALGYATKDEPFESVVTAIRAVHAGRRYLSPVLSRADVDEWVRTQSAGDPLAALTTREREVFDLAVQGLTSAQIGDRLAVSRRTVESHRSRILMKLHARSVLDLVRIAARCGVLKGQQESVSGGLRVRR